MAHDHPLNTTGTTTGASGNTEELTQDRAVPGLSAALPRRDRLSAVWNAVTAFIATVVGLAPHVLHHVGLFAGAAFVVGTAGNLLFGAVGLLLSIPLLRRLYRRFGTWKAPAATLAVFAAMFSLSAFVIGPAISGNDEPAPSPSQRVPPDEHAEHHR